MGAAVSQFQPVPAYSSPPAVKGEEKHSSKAPGWREGNTAKQ